MGRYNKRKIVNGNARYYRKYILQQKYPIHFNHTFLTYNLDLTLRVNYFFQFSNWNHYEIMPIISI